MKKLILRLDELAVESFVITEAGGGSGTVRANAETPCCTFSCGGTCGAAPDSETLRLALTFTNCPQCCV